MEYTFISKDTFNGIVEHYIAKLPASKQKKALIDLELLNEIKEILLNPKHRSNEEVSVKYHHPMINRYGNDCIPIGL